jgi:hypothetical protein
MAMVTAEKTVAAMAAVAAMTAVTPMAAVTGHRNVVPADQRKADDRQEHRNPQSDNTIHPRLLKRTGRAKESNT